MLPVVVFAVWASVTDAKRRLLPNRLLGAMCISALLCLLLRTVGDPWLPLLPWLAALDPSLPSPSTCLLLTVVLTATLTLVECTCRALTHGPGMGFGDIKLLACWTLALGTWSILAFTCACATGAMWGLANREKTFPLGPFITAWSIAITIYMLF